MSLLYFLFLKTLGQGKMAGISHLKTVKTLKMDSPKGDYTRRKGMYFPPQKVKTLKMDSPKGDYTRRKGQVCPTSKKSKA